MIIRDAQALLGMLEQGDVNRDLTGKLQNTVKALLEMSRDNPRAVFKAVVKLELHVEIKDGGEMVAINPKIPEPKLPELKRRTTLYFTHDDGSIATEHPQQLDFVGGPREVFNR